MQEVPSLAAIIAVIENNSQIRAEVATHLGIAEDAVRNNGGFQDVNNKSSGYKYEKPRRFAAAGLGLIVPGWAPMAHHLPSAAGKSQPSPSTAAQRGP